MSKNCPNCGAPYDEDKNKCPYCGTSYYDMSGIDFSNGEPFYLKIKSNMNINGEYQDVYITQLVRPELGNIEMSNETIDTTDCYGRRIHSFVSNRSVTTHISFTAIPDKDNELIKIITK